MKSFIKLACISLTAIFAIYLFAGQTRTQKQTPPPDKQVKVSAIQKTTAAVAPKDILLAEIDGQKITGADFNQYLSLFKNNDQGHSASPALRERQIKNLINRILLLEEARKQGYFKNEDLKKHGSLDPIEHETIVLRQFLTDKISQPATIDETELKTYLETHSQFSSEQAREQLTSKRQQQLFQELMHDLQKVHKIVIFRENLARF